MSSSPSSSSSPLPRNPDNKIDPTSNVDQEESGIKPLFSSNSPYASLPIQPGQSKSSIKKAFKREKWQAGKLDRRKKEKERKKERRLAQKIQEKESNQNQDEEPVGQGQGQAEGTESQHRRSQGQKQKTSQRRIVEKNCRIVIDCGFDDLMSEQEIVSMSSQIGYLYAVNRSSSNPFKSIIISGSNLIRGGNYCSITKKVKDASGNEKEIQTEEISRPHESAIQEALASGSKDSERAEIESCGGWNEESNPRPEEYKDLKPTSGSKSNSGFGKGWNPSIFNGRVGKRMEITMKGDWRKWKRVEILEKGGLEALWEKGEDLDEEKGDSKKQVGKESTEGSSSSRNEAIRKEPEIDQMEGIEKEGLKTENPPKSHRDAAETGLEKLKKGSMQDTFRSQNHRQASWECTEKFNKEDIIYLTADTDETIEELEDGKVYVLGGIVDRNRYKFLCSNKAKALGLKTARLPLDPKFLFNERELKTRKVLTVNQVIEILVGHNEERDWKLAIERGLPTRKLDVEGRKGEKRKRGGQIVGEGEGEGPAEIEEKETR